MIASFALAMPLLTASMPETGTLSSTQATYDGNALILNGHVQLDHGLGQMMAVNASLQRQETGKDFPFSLIHLEKEVHLHLKNSAQLDCAAADLDFSLLTGHLTSSETEPVIYTDTLKNKAFLQLKSKQIDLKFSKNGYDGKKTDYEIDTILAQEDVVINYAHLFLLSAHHALYKKSSSKENKALQGILTAYPEGPGDLCHLTHAEDQIDARSIDLDLFQAKICMHHPQGTLYSASLARLPQEGKIAFSCDLLTWEYAKNTLTLQGAVDASHSAFGTLITDDELQLIQTDKHLLKTIRSKGKTLLRYRDPQDQTERKLTCFGTLLLDQEHLQAKLLSSDQPLYYEEDKIGIYANEATIDYSATGELLEPVSITLKGNVRLLSKDAEGKQRYALAGRLNYAPATRTLILAADPGKKVLFWDRAQNMRLSAQEVHVTRDLASNEDVIRGIGNVQMAFTSDENTLLKNSFPGYEP